MQNCDSRVRGLDFRRCIPRFVSAGEWLFPILIRIGSRKHNDWLDTGRSLCRVGLASFGFVTISLTNTKNFAQASLVITPLEWCGV